MISYKLSYEMIHVVGNLNYSDVVMSAKASQITAVSIVCLTVQAQIKENMKAQHQMQNSTQSETK